MTPMNPLIPSILEPARGGLARRFFQDSLFDRLFDDLMTRWPNLVQTDLQARPIDVRETDDEYLVSCEVPGYDPADVKVELNGDVLTIRADVEQEEETGEAQEERYRSFLRQVNLGGLVDVDNVRAEHRHGVLRITLPKQESSKPKRIPIESSEKARTLDVAAAT